MGYSGAIILPGNEVWNEAYLLLDTAAARSYLLLTILKIKFNSMLLGALHSQSYFMSDL